MWGFLGNLFAGGIGSILSGTRDVARVFTVDKTVREENIHGEQTAAQAQLAAEFAGRQPQNWWDSLIDGFNRLPRPLMALSVIVLFMLPTYDPLWFAQIMQGYALVPSWLSYVWAQIIFLYFGGRMFENWNGRTDPPTPEHIRSVMQTIAEVRAIRRDEDDRTRTERQMQAQAEALASTDQAVLPQHRDHEEVVEAPRQSEIPGGPPVLNAAIAAWRAVRGS